VYNTILVVVCRFSKIVRFIPYYNTVDVDELDTILINKIFSKYDTPRLIVSDRGIIFIFKY
jgi:hypothetical protein